MIFNTSNEKGAAALRENTEFLISQKALVKQEMVKQTRTSAQNAALHLYFTHCATALNDVGIYYHYFGLDWVEYEIPWTPEMFKEYTWKPIQETMYGFKSTTKLKTNQIDPIFDVINKIFSDLGIRVEFPNNFSHYLKFYEKQ